MLNSFVTSARKTFVNGPFAGYDHMVQNPPCWDANCALGNPKQSDLNNSFFVLDVPMRSLRSSMADFVPCDRILQRAYYNSFACCK